MNIFLVKSIIGYARTMEPVIRALKTNTSKKIAINNGLFPTVLLPKVPVQQKNYRHNIRYQP
ncbi:MAG: hypothetical protein ACYCXB_04480 [Candidatus Humimicrobiaceae bacterium]